MIMSKLLIVMAFANIIYLCNSSKSHNIFLLAGQSNMAGLGGVVNNTWEGVVPPECGPNHNILKLNAQLRWKKAKEPLSSDIDTKWTMGIGPGMPFANSILKKNSSFGVVCLVPCAISGTKMIEWAKGTSLYNQLIVRAKASLRKGGSIRALLWYQGESDTTLKPNADAYKGRLQTFFKDVALASGLNFTEMVREAQMNIGLPNIKVVDAKGLPLQLDNIHLTTPAQVRLGNLLADAFLSTLSNKHYCNTNI
ncbi:hypothetical protein Leryth_015044 [Lithospermum erythrorhizon]|nr:hypothetical protein Leryth_015044 [Lithospermum erythrorhizon]